MRKSLSKKQGFTLLEMLITMVIFFSMITVVTTIFIYIYKSKGALEARQTVTKESYFFLEKLQVMSKDFTIDYEEYWNRQQVGCLSPQNPQWSLTGNCAMMTYYGNKNSVYLDNDNNGYYYCSSLTGEDTPFAVGNGANRQECLFDNSRSIANRFFSANVTYSGFLQSYGQYNKLFTDVKDDVDYVPGVVKDDDDQELGQGPLAIFQTGIVYPQELYLISHDKERRLLFRRKLVEENDYNYDGITGDNEKLYTIQVLQLKGFDAGIHHDFDTVYSGVYDGIIDTWACDYSLGFQCHGASVSGAYTDFQLPLNVDDGWQDLLTNDLTISDWNIVISPLVDPYLAWAEDESQINPFFSIGFTAKLYGKNWSLKIPWNQMDKYNLKLETSFSTSPSNSK